MFIEQPLSLERIAPEERNVCNEIRFRSYGAQAVLITAVSINVLLLRSLRRGARAASKQSHPSYALAVFFFCLGLLRGGFEVGC